MGDLTIIYITANVLPDAWCEHQRLVLTAAANGAPIVCISRKPVAFGNRNILDTHPKSYWNIYRQLRIGAQAAETAYVAMAEDDVLYTKEHFVEFRPKDNVVSYDRSRWSLFAWENAPMYCLRNRVSNCTLIAPREYLIDALLEREKRWPDGYPRDDLVGEVGREIVERNLDVPRRNATEWYCSNPVVQVNHVYGTDDRQTAKWKKHGQVKAWDIPFWGPAKGLADVFNACGNEQKDH